MLSWCFSCYNLCSLSLNLFCTVLRKAQLFLLCVLSQHTSRQITVPQPSGLHPEQSQLSQAVLIHQGLHMPNNYGGFSEGLLQFDSLSFTGEFSTGPSTPRLTSTIQRKDLPRWQSSFQCRRGCPYPRLMLEQNAAIC